MKRFIKGKRILGIAIVVMMSMVLVSCGTSKYPYGAKEIRVDEYKEYDNFGVSYNDDESECFTFLENLLKDSKKTVGHESKDIMVYMYNDLDESVLNSISEKIESCAEVVEVGYAEFAKGGDAEYMIHFTTNDGQTVMTSYSKDGIYNKTLDYEDKIVQVVTEAKKEIRYVLETPKTEK